jgi:hypothetical protein
LSEYQSHSHNRNYGCRIVEFILEGFHAVSLENEKIRVTILIDKGTDIYEFLYKPHDVDFLWRSRVGLRPMEHFQPMSPVASGAFLEFYEGGWQEMFPWGGHASEFRGVNTGMHGEVALTPWDFRIDVDTPEEVCVTCSVRTRRMPFLLHKTFALYRNRAQLHILEKVQNESNNEFPVVWGHHPAFGWPFLDDSCVLDLPSCRFKVGASLDETSRLEPNQEGVWPEARLLRGGVTDLSRIPGPEIRCQDLAYLVDLKEGWYALRSQSRKLGFGLAWDKSVFPYLWFWHNFRGSPDYPFWGEEYVAAVEPATSIALKFSDALANGTAKLVRGHATIESELWAWAFEGTNPVSRVTRDGVDFSSQ